MPDTADQLTSRQLADRLGVGEQTIFRWKRDGRLPAPLALTGRTLRWSKATIDAWTKAGFQTSVEAWDDDLRAIAGVRAGLQAFVDAGTEGGFNGDFAVLAGTGQKVLKSRKVPIEERLKVARFLTTEFDLSKGIEPSAEEVLQARRETLRLNSILRTAGGAP